jgi:hypothetical protein
MISDYKGSKAASRVRRAVNSNPFLNIQSQVSGVVGGIWKTAFVAAGVPERVIQERLLEANDIAFSGTINTSAQAQSLAYLNQALGMKAPGTSYASAVPSFNDQRGLVKELGQQAVVEVLSAGKSREEREVINATLRSAYGSYERRRSEDKAQTEAGRSTAITAVTTLATMGASGALGGVVKGAMTAMGAGTAQVGAQVVGLVVQTIDGTRNGIDGMLAGFANGALGILTAGGKFDIVKPFKDAAGVMQQGTVLGLGISYDRIDGYGGMIGVGGAKGNVNVSFSQRGNTSVNGSLDTRTSGLQLTGSMTTNGEQTVGLNYNADNRGPRQGWNLSGNYDLNGGGLSGSLGYTDPTSMLGLTSTIGGNGLSTSSQYNGNNIGTMTANGYTTEEFNWMLNNINNAQNRTDELRHMAALVAEGATPSVLERLGTDNETDADSEIASRAQERQLMQDVGMTEDQIQRLADPNHAEERGLCIKIV